MPKHDRFLKQRTFAVLFDGRTLKNDSVQVQTKENGIMQITGNNGVRFQVDKNTPVEVRVTEVVKDRKTPVQYTIATGKVISRKPNSFEIELPESIQLPLNGEYSVQLPKETVKKIPLWQVVEGIIGDK